MPHIHTLAVLAVALIAGLCGVLVFLLTAGDHQGLAIRATALVALASVTSIVALAAIRGGGPPKDPPEDQFPRLAG